MSKKVGREAIRQVAIVLATCITLSACSASTKPHDAEVSTAATHANSGSAKSASTAPAPLHRAAAEGKNYEWGKDHIFIKLSSAETGGVLTLIQDNLKAGFDLGLHLHRSHTEIFYILDGEVEFMIGKKLVTATAGAVVYIPAGTSHAARSSTDGRMLMFYTPGGFDEMLAEIDEASWFQLLNPFANAKRDEKYDNHKVSDGAQPARDGLKPLYLAPGKGKEIEGGTGNSAIKLSSADTEGLAIVIEETLKPGTNREPRHQSNQTEILYVLDGEVEFKIADKMHVAVAGATIYFPPGILAKLNSPKGAKMLVFRTSGIAAPE